MGPFLEADAVCAITSPGRPKTGDVGEQQARPGTAPLPAPTADGQMMLDRGPQPPAHNSAMALPPRKPLSPESARGPPRQTGLEYPKNHPKNRLPTDWKCRLAAKALALKSENAGNFLAQAVRHAWPDTREFSPAAFYNLATRKEREEYRREKKLFESRKQTVQKYIDAYTKGEYDGLRKDRSRASGAGRPTENRELKEILYEYFLHVGRSLGGRVGVNLLRAKASAIIAANAEECGVALDEGGRVNQTWLGRFLRRFLREYNLTVRKKNCTAKCSSKEIERRLGAYWRNVIRVRAHFLPETVQFDAYDHTPIYRRENAGKMVAPVGAERVGAVEDNSGDKARHTVVLFSSTDGCAKSPEVMFKATDPSRIRDIDWGRAPANVSVRFSPSATYDAGATKEMLKEKFGQRSVREELGPSFRCLIMDQFAGQITPDVIREMVKYRKIPLCIWGHLTPLVQVADRVQNAAFKDLYKQNEAEKVASILIKHPHGVPKLTRDEILRIVDRTHKQLESTPGHPATVRDQFRKTGTTISLDGSEDICIDEKLRPYWDALGMPTWRQEYLEGIKSGEIERAPNALELIRSLENPHSVGVDVAEEDMWWADMGDDEVVAALEDMGSAGPGGDEAGREEQLAGALKRQYGGHGRQKAAGSAAEGEGGRQEEREAERGAKRLKLVREATSLLERMPSKADGPETKRAFSEGLAELVSKMEVSPRFKKAAGDYLKIRGRQSADREKKREIKKRHEDAERAAIEEARKESEEMQEKRALLRGPPAPKRGKGRKKLDITDEERKERAKKQRRAAYMRKKGERRGPSVGGEGNIGGSDGGAGRQDGEEYQIAEYDSGESARQEGGQLALYQEGESTYKNRQVSQADKQPREDTDTESSVDI